MKTRPKTYDIQENDDGAERKSKRKVRNALEVYWQIHEVVSGLRFVRVHNAIVAAETMLIEQSQKHGLAVEASQHRKR